MDNKQEIKILIKWLLIGLFSGIAIAVIATVCSTLINSTSSGRYVAETYCADEYYTGKEDCNWNGYEDVCTPVTECAGGIQTRYVSMGEHLKSSLKTNIITGIGLGMVAGFFVTVYVLQKMKEKIRKQKWEKEREQS